MDNENSHSIKIGNFILRNEADGLWLTTIDGDGFQVSKLLPELEKVIKKFFDDNM